MASLIKQTKNDIDMMIILYDYLTPVTTQKHRLIIRRRLVHAVTLDAKTDWLVMFNHFGSGAQIVVEAAAEFKNISPLLFSFSLFSIFFFLSSSFTNKQPDDQRRRRRQKHI